MKRSELKKAAKAQIKGNVWTFFVVNLLNSLLTGVTIGILSPAINTSVCAMYLQLTRGEEVSVGDMFCRMKTLGKSWWLMILIAFFLSLWSMLAAIPGMIKSYAYSMAYYALAENPELTARQALRRSKQIMKGHKWQRCVLDLSFFWWHLLGGITFGLAYIYIVPYMNATVANFYRAISAEAPVAE